METEEKPSAEKVVSDKLTAAYEAANDEDRAQVRELVERAKTGKRGSLVVALRSGAAAILFHDYNKQNRAWRYAVTMDYTQQMETGEWEFTNQGIGFLDSGDLGDGQHRCSGVALAGRPIEMTVTFGMTLGSIIAIDTGHRRQASDFLGINNQMTEPKRKQVMVRQAFSTLKRLAGDNDEAARPYVLRSGNRDMVGAMQAHDRLLTEAMEIGDESVRGRAKPTFKANEAASLAFVLLLKGWPKVKVIADLDTFQSGEDREGGNAPLFVAADQLQKDAQKREGATVTARFAAAIKAFVLHEQGIKNVRVADIRNVMKTRTGVDPSYPGTAQVLPFTA